MTRRFADLVANTNRDRMNQCIGGCTTCNQRFVGRGPVLPSGPTPNDLMILVDAPPFADDRAGRVTHDGEPGRRLLTELRKAGVDPRDVFFGHVVSCWPGQGGVTAPLARTCRDNVRLQIKACDPKMIITLGAHALDAVSDRKRTLKADRGKPFVVQAGPAIDRTVFPTYHPAGFKYDGRDTSKLNHFSADIATAVRHLKELP